MGFKDIFNKGIDAIKSGANAVKEAAKEKKTAIQEFDLLKTKSEHIGPMQKLVQNNNEPQIGKEQLILNMCPNINVEQAKLVNTIIPIEETIINVKASKEAKTLIEYIFVVTNVNLWILNQNEYITYEFNAIKNFEIISKGVMSQSVKFNDNAWVISGSEDEIKTLCEILLREDVRVMTVAAKTKYLCGIIPHKQILNMNMKGISIGDNKQIVLHNTPDNKLVSLNDIAYVQLLINDSVVLVKGKEGVDQGSMVSTPLEARKMSVKVIPSMGEYVIETMSSNMFNKSYKREESTYINNYEYSKKLVDTIASMVEENRRGGYNQTPQVNPVPESNVVNNTNTEPTPLEQPPLKNPTPKEINNIPNVSEVFGTTPNQTTQNQPNSTDSSDTDETFTL